MKNLKTLTSKAACGGIVPAEVDIRLEVCNPIIE